MWIGDFCAPRTARPANPKRRWREMSLEIVLLLFLLAGVNSFVLLMTLVSLLKLRKESAADRRRMEILRRRFSPDGMPPSRWDATP